MKREIHPKYFEKAVATCSCGAKHAIGSTREKMTVEICSECHPFYTGKEKLVDTAGRVEKFRARRKRAETTKEIKSKKVPTSSKSTKGDLGKKSRILDSSMRSAQDESGQKKTPKKKTSKKKSAKGALPAGRQGSASGGKATPAKKPAAKKK